MTQVRRIKYCIIIKIKSRVYFNCATLCYINERQAGWCSKQTTRARFQLDSSSWKKVTYPPRLKNGWSYISTQIFFIALVPSLNILNYTFLDASHILLEHEFNWIESPFFPIFHSFEKCLLLPTASIFNTCHCLLTSCLFPYKYILLKLDLCGKQTFKCILCSSIMHINKWLLIQQTNKQTQCRCGSTNSEIFEKRNWWLHVRLYSKFKKRVFLL